MTVEGEINRPAVWTVILADAADAQRRMAAVGVSPRGIEIMTAKYTRRAVFVKGLSAPAANVLKQVALSAGGEAAVHREAITCRVSCSDALLFGTRAVLASVAEKLSHQSFGLEKVGEEIARILATWDNPPTLTLGGKTFDLSTPLVIGILNVTPDSFYDGGRYPDAAAAVARAREMAEEGAAVVDVGGESSRPGAAYITEEEELKRVMPVVEAVAPEVRVSVDTRRAGVARRAAEAGAVMINDISAGRDDPNIAGVCAEYDLPLVVMHMQGTPATMQENPVYGDVVAEVREFLRERAQWAKAEGVNQVIVDPGIGFGKTLEHNLSLLNNISALCDLSYPVMVGHSRKRFIGALTGEEAEGRLAGSVAAALEAARRGAHLLRVHDVKETAQALAVARAMNTGRGDMLQV